MGEIESNLKLKSSNYVIPLIAVYRDISFARQGPIKAEIHHFNLIFDFGITLADYLKNLLNNQIENLSTLDFQ